MRDIFIILTSKYKEHLNLNKNLVSFECNLVMASFIGKEITEALSSSKRQ